MRRALGRRLGYQELPKTAPDIQCRAAHRRSWRVTDLLSYVQPNDQASAVALQLARLAPALILYIMQQPLVSVQFGGEDLPMLEALFPRAHVQLQVRANKVFAIDRHQNALM